MLSLYGRAASILHRYNSTYPVYFGSCDAKSGMMIGKPEALQHSCPKQKKTETLVISLTPHEAGHCVCPKPKVRIPKWKQSTSSTEHETVALCLCLLHISPLSQHWNQSMIEFVVYMALWRPQGLRTPRISQAALNTVNVMTSTISERASPLEMP